MKKISLFAILLTAAAMTACTDYKAQISEAHDEAQTNALRAAAEAAMEGLSGGEPIADLPILSSGSSSDYSAIPCGDIWCGRQTPHSEHYDVRWFSYIDSVGSYFTFDDTTTINSTVDFSSLVDNYGYVGGNYWLWTQSSKSTYASVVAQIGNPDGSSYWDVTSGGGICVVYSSTSQLKMMLSFIDEKEDCGYDKPMVLLPENGNTYPPVVAEFTWDQFEQECWANKPVNIYDVIIKLYGFDFQFAEKYSDNTGFFRIYSIGYLGTCTNHY